MYTLIFTICKCLGVPSLGKTSHCKTPNYLHMVELMGRGAQPAITHAHGRKENSFLAQPGRTVFIFTPTSKVNQEKATSNSRSKNGTCKQHKLTWKNEDTYHCSCCLGRNISHVQLCYTILSWMHLYREL